MSKASIQKKYTLFNSGNEIYNDVIIDELFELNNNEYEIVIEPKTEFWRFGIRLSKTNKIEFYHPTDRYKSSEFWNNYIDIHLGVGEWDAVNWSKPNAIHFVEYNINNTEKNIEAQRAYSPLEKVQWSFGKSNDILRLSYSTAGSTPFAKDVLLPNEFKYFKFFAWADEIDFSLEVTLSIQKVKEQQSNQESFTIENITFRKGNIFDTNILNSTDLVVLPCSSNSSTVSKVKDKANEYRIPLPKKSNHGSVKYHQFNFERRLLFWAWAYSINTENGSSLDIISKICINLINEAVNNDLETISLPLLGTGAGKLNKIEIFELYIKIFTTQGQKNKFYVNVLNEEDFQTIQNYNIKNSGSTEVKRPINKIPFSFRDKSNIDPVLGIKDLGKEVAGIIENLPPTEQGAMIGIFGKWGRGKSYFINNIWDVLSKNKKIRKIDFHAWKYQDTPAIWAYLYEQFANEYYSPKLNKFNLLKRRISLNYKRFGSGKIFAFLIPLAISIISSFLFPFYLKLKIIWKLISYFGVSMLTGFGIIYYKYEKSAKSLLKEYYSKFTFSKILGVQAEVQKELTNLISTWCKLDRVDKIILVVDDIDRCSENKIVEIIDSLRVMLEDDNISQKVIVIAAIDEEILQHALLHKYDFLNKHWDKEHKDSKFHALTSQYLDKIFILGIKLGEISANERDEFFIELTKKDRELIETTPFINLESSPNKLNTRELSFYNNSGESRVEEFKSTNSQNETTIKSDQKNTNSVEESTFDKITNDEFNCLRKCLKKYNGITPRQIRIFYYRFILAKNLLVTQYRKLNRQNIWVEPDNSGILIDLLIQYSKFEHRSSLSKHKEDVFSLKSDLAKVQLIEHRNYKTEDYRELLKVLDIVIAY